MECFATANKGGQRHCEQQGSAIVSAAIFDYSGVKLRQQNIQNLSENINVGGLPGGMYFLVVQGNERGIFARKIVVQH